MEQYLLAIAFGCSTVGAIAALILLVRQRRITSLLSRQYAELANDVAIRDEELGHLATTRLPELMESLHGRPVAVPRPLHEARIHGTQFERNLVKVIDLFAESVEQARSRADVSARATLRAMMRTVQSLANEQQVVISEMQDRHDDPDVLADLLRIDHMNAQLGRRSQATAVLCGAWPGQQRSAASVNDLARGATSRIRDYLRVKVHGQVNIAVVSRAVEPVVLALAELLDNAARHSHPDTAVEVNFQPTHNGVAVMIDDAGVAMDAEALQQAAALLSGHHPLNIHRLGDPPQIGFAVVGLLAARYGFTVSVDTRSPYGGVRAVLFLPSALLTRPPAETAPAGQVERRQASTSAVPEVVSQTEGGLPKRRRVAALEQPVPEHAADPPVRTARETAAGMGAWQRGTRSGRATTTDREGNGLRP